MASSATQRLSFGRVSSNDSSESGRVTKWAMDEEEDELLRQAAANRELARMARRTLKGLFRPEDRARLAQYADQLDRRALAIEQEHEAERNPKR